MNNANAGSHGGRKAKIMASAHLEESECKFFLGACGISDDEDS
jgi:hypothetical protein